MADDTPPRARPFALALAAAFALTLAVAVLVPLWVTGRDMPAAQR